MQRLLVRPGFLLYYIGLYDVLSLLERMCLCSVWLRGPGFSGYTSRPQVPQQGRAAERRGATRKFFHLLHVYEH